MMSWLLKKNRGATLSLMISVAFTMVFSDTADARKRRRKRPKHSSKVATAAAEAESQAAVDGLMGKLRWGMSLAQVKAEVSAKIRASYLAARSEVADPIEQDRMRQAEELEVKALTKSYYTFSGARSPWDVSLVEHEFAHRNNESVLVVWEKNERRFYFFHHERLWKVYIAFNSDVYKDKTFDDFAAAMEARFGAAERKYRTNLKGEAEESHLEWPTFSGPGSGRTVLKAVDNTGFYGNFCLVLEDNIASQSVFSSRKQKKTDGRAHRADRLIDMVTDTTKGPDPHMRANENIVDRLTGSDSTSPVKSTPDASSKNHK